MDDGDRLTLSGSHLTTVQQLARAVAIPRVELTVEKEAGREVGRKVVLEGDIFKLGSHASNDVVIADRLVSRFHCQLARGDAGWTISDSGSMNGTSVNGVRIRDADLPRPTCRIELGESVVQVRELGSAAVAEIPTIVSF